MTFSESCASVPICQPFGKHDAHPGTAVEDLVSDAACCSQIAKRLASRRRFVVRVLRHELAAHGEVEDGLAQLLDLVGARGERRQRVEREAGVVLEGFGIGRVEAGEARRRQPVARRLPLRPRRLQPVAQRHQLIDLGDDAVLLGEGWEGKGQVAIRSAR